MIRKNQKLLVLLALFTSMSTTLCAQPAPPDPEGGNPVPVGGAIYLLLAAITAVGAWKLFRKEK